MCPSHRKKNNAYNETPTQNGTPMTKTDLAKRVVSFVVGAGTHKIVKAIINNNIAPEKVTDKVAVEAAAFVIGALVASACKEYTEKMIDDLIEQWTKLKSSIKEAREA